MSNPQAMAMHHHSRERQGTFGRPSALAGVAGVVLYGIALPLAPMPPAWDDPAATFISYTVKHREALYWQLALVDLALVLLLWFAACLAAWLRDKGERGYALAVLGGAAAATGVSAAASACGWVAVQGGSHGELESGIVKALMSLQASMVGVAALCDVVIFAAAGLAILRGGALPRLLGAWGIVAALVATATTMLADVHWLPLVEGTVAFSWVAIASVLLSRRTPNAIDALRN